ncbi:MAG: O-antigen ligase family protein [Pirellulaceae bacterium]
MNSAQTGYRLTAAPTGGLRPLITIGLLLLVCVAPWFFGSVLLEARLPLLLLATVLLGVDIIQLYWDTRRSSSLTTLPWVCLFPIVGVVLGVMQLVSFPSENAEMFAPRAAELRRELIPEYSNPVSDGVPLPIARTRTLYPPATRSAVGLLLLATTAFWLAIRLDGHDREAAWLLSFALLLGAALTFWGLVQKFTWNGMMYWFVPLQNGGIPFGPFVNRNNAGGFLNLCLACGIGWMYWRSVDGRLEVTSAARPPDASQRWANPAVWIANLNAHQLLTLGGVVFIAGGVMATISRGSIVAFAAASGVTFGILLLRSGNRALAAGMMVLALLAVGLVWWLGQMVEIRERFETVVDESGSVVDGRLENWAEAMHAFPAYAGWGAGLDAYRFAYIPFQQRYSGNAWNYHAENQFIQALLDAGVVGCGLLVLAILGMVMAIGVLYRSGGRVNTALATAGTFGLVSQTVGGFLISDFTFRQMQF